MIKQSPIFYMGNKKKLIEKHHLVDLFPENISTFVDVFCGSGTVSMNVEAENYILNDYNKTIIELLNLFKTHDYNYIINYIEQTIKEHELLKGFNKRDPRETEEYKKKAQDNYNAFRTYYNTVDNSVLNLYVLSYYCNNNNIRFNKSGQFNMPIGNQYFNKEKHSQKIKDGCEFFSQDNVILNHGSFRDLDVSKLDKDSFCYLDPPYANTDAIYNEQGGWTNKDENDLYNLCEKLDDNGIKFAMSNVFANKDFVNTKLIDWCSDCSWNVHEFEDFTYVSCGKGNARTKEVLIRNY